jgi:hypothetical protein
MRALKKVNLKGIRQYIMTNPEINISGMITTFSSIISKKQGVLRQ